ncbi:MAG: hypothetical protein H7301_11755 [Cryobacterium sp.]|nr:hypothetical protein [Oligoflexia bacterium]
MSKLTPAHFSRIRDVVEKAETQTSGEIVPVVLKHAADYAWIHSVLTLQGLLIGVLGSLVWESVHAWPVTGGHSRLIALVGGALGLCASFIPSVARSAIGKKRLDHESHTRAFSEFIKKGCAETSGRTGVLVLLSLFERRIVIVADRGIQTKVLAVEGADVWDRLCTDFVAHAKKGEAIEGLATVIERIGTLLAKYFPRSETDRNELPNDLREEDSE